jgi:hypothetical protein
VISDFNYIAKDLLGIKNPNIRRPEQLKKVINYVVGGALLNTAMDEMGLPTVVPSPISDMKREMERPGVRGLDVVGAGAKSLAQKIPVVGGHARFGGSLLGPLATFGENIFEGKESIPTAATKLAGVPVTVQLQKLLPMMVGDEEFNAENLKSALFGKTADQYETERGTKDLAPEKRFMQGLREPVDSSLEELLKLVD